MEDIKEKTADERDKIINDLNAIAYTRPYFSGIIAKTTRYIIELEQENKELIYKYHKALDNTITSDRELIKFKDTTKEIRKKIEFDFNYCLDDVTADLNKLLGDE